MEKAGKTTQVDVFRGGKSMTLDVVLTARKDMDA